MDFALLIAGIVCAGLGGEFFVRGVVGIARWARISSGIIGATFAAFATSSPEFSVSIASALSGTPQIALGDALGSNIANIGLIIGVALLFAPLHAPRDTTKRDFPVALLVPLLLGVLTLDGLISTFDGLILFAMFMVWLTLMVIEARRQRSNAGAVLGEAHHGRALVMSIAGMGFLVASGQLIVSGATGIVTATGIDPFIVGSTLVAIGTSSPEIATVVISRIRRHDEVALGTILGSNIFNGLFIVGIAAIIKPIPIHWQDVTVGLVFGVLTTLLTFPRKGTTLERRRGIVLLALYAAYMGISIQGAR